MSVYCYVCCSYCKKHEKCEMRNGGCEQCDYWKYGECTNPQQIDEELFGQSKSQPMATKAPSQ